MRNLITAITVVMLFGSFAFAQDGEPIVEMNLKPAVGIGSFFGEETETFDTDALFGTVRLRALELPFQDANTGVSAEINFDSASNEVGYAVWSLNRADVIKGKMYGGADMKVLQSGAEGVRADFDLRLVTGVYLGAIGEGKSLSMEFYALEENRPIAFAVLFNF